MTSQPTFNELLRQAYHLYQNEAYAQAFDLITREANRFPEQTPKIYFWRICLASRMDKTELALDLLKEAIDAGYWYSTNLLRTDTDLEPLQGLPAFEELVEICAERHATAQAKTTPSLIMLEPKSTSLITRPPWPLLMALHGHNGNAKMSIDPWRPMTSRGWLLALPQSSQIIASDGYTWIDKERAKREIQIHYATLSEQHTIDQERVIVGGFSMGGGLAIELAWSSAMPMCGFIAVAPYLSDINHVISFLEFSKGTKVRGYITVGELDNVCYENSQTLAAQLQARNLPCKLEIHPDLGHEYPLDFEKVLTRALEFILCD